MFCCSECGINFFFIYVCDRISTNCVFPEIAAVQLLELLISKVPRIELEDCGGPLTCTGHFSALLNLIS